MNFLRGATVLVLGLGESGLAMARWCVRCGADVRVWDTRWNDVDAAPRLVARLLEQVPAARWVDGPLDGGANDALAGVRLVLKSPGLSPFDTRIAAVLQRAGASGVPVLGELALFARALADLKAERGYAPKVLAITGTNGKTTTTAMTAYLIERTGRRVASAGNIGPTMLQTLGDALDREPRSGAAHASDDVAVMSGRTDIAGALGREAGLVAAPGGQPALFNPVGASVRVAGAAPQPPFEALPEVWVIELSSFQLDGVEGFDASAAAVLNVSQDHLDWHGSMAHYAAAKARIFGAGTVAVVNRDDAFVERMVADAEQASMPRGAKSQSKSETRNKSETETEPHTKTPVATRLKGRRAGTMRPVVRFGLDTPRRPGDFGLVEENGIAWLARAGASDETRRRSRGGVPPSDAGLQGAPEALPIQRLMPADALRVRGRHNAANALAALALATAIDCPLAPMLHALREYAGEPHRVQHVATLDGVDAFDDSKGTNVGATVAALEGLGADKAPGKLVVILGGDGKGQDFAPLAEPVRRHARAVALIGRDAALIQAALAATGVPLQRHETLQAATRSGFAVAHAGDAVLLSPACASLDMFRNYAHRAEVFVDEVKAIVADRGGIAA